MAAAAAALSRLPLFVVDEGQVSSLDSYSPSSPSAPPRRPISWRNDTFASRYHAYLHSLALGEESCQTQEEDGEEPRHKHPAWGLGLSLPQNIVTRGPVRRGARRTLSESHISHKSIAMASAAINAPVDEPDTAPSSPPELSYSKSSNSSLRSDSSDEEETVGKLANFEDIAIEDAERDSIEDSNLRPESRPTLKRPRPRSILTTDGVRTGSSPSIPPPPNRFAHLRGPESPLSPLPNGLGLRRGFSSPSAPSLFTLGAQRSSRSPSPTKPFMQNGVSVSPQALASATPKLSNELRSPSTTNHSLFARRKSWQPGQATRKTAKEIEADYNDDDGEVPLDYVLENVPISPMPGQPRLSQSYSRPQSRSATPSPQRRPSYTNLHSANVPKGAKRPSAPKVLPNGQYAKPRSPRNSRPNTLQHSLTISSFPPGQSLEAKHRSKSWTDDLNEEARVLSAALEEFADRTSTEKQAVIATTLSSSPPSEPIFLAHRKKSATFDLPPVQKGNIMIDPLPISKEKEAVLSRTRPSWLPPKSQKEEKKHMREWEQMMARAAENEKKRALKQREIQETQVEMKDSIARIWDQHVLPNWELVVKEPRTRELWWRGVTPRSRGIVWQRAIGNELELSPSSFEAALNRAVELEEKIAESSTPEDRNKTREAAWFDAIARDVRTACPAAVSSAKERQQFETDLANVLKAYAMYRSDVGYVYGTHLVAGLLCLHLRPSDAFVTLANLLNRPVPLAFHVHDVAAMRRAYDAVLGTLRYKFPKLHGHLTSCPGLQAEEFLDPIFRCLFAYHLPVEHVSRVWDLFVFEGDKILVRAAVAVLGKLEGRLYGSREEVLALLGWGHEGVWEIGDEEEFVAAVREAGKVDSKGEVKGN